MGMAASNGQNLSLRKIADKFGVSHGAVQRVLQGIEPKDNKIRAAFGLPTYAPAPVCIHCGLVHVTKRCTQRTPHKPSKPRRNYKQIAAGLLGALWGGK